eukprot:TRINITY_DN5447_c0_g1_i1.p1 TRINITY_DN5447_c0_g1~~TRINITY_DN5447_c0_g1_i1.p1  ORF type:complete len:350 (-),score=72.19 TRINITY_DN5447_c0_g1_i1:114-1163(-)
MKRGHSPSAEDDLPPAKKHKSDDSQGEPTQPVKILITGAAGQIAYSLIFMIARGELFGTRPLVLHLLDIEFCKEALHGVVLEIEDCAFPLVKEVIGTTDVKQAFTDIDVAILVGAFPRKEGMERKDLLEKNGSIFKEQGKALNDYAKKTVKVLVVGNPANTNCLIAIRNAPDIPKENFSALTRLDHNRAVYQLARKANLPINSIKKVTIWGNHSRTQFADASNAISGDKSVPALIADDDWLKTKFVEVVQNRGGEILKARRFSSAASAANAIIEHLRDWIFSTPTGDWVSMAVYSDGSYGVKEGLVYSFPVTCVDGKYEIVKGLEINDFSRNKMKETEKELEEEKALIP